VSSLLVLAVDVAHWGFFLFRVVIVMDPWSSWWSSIMVEVSVDMRLNLRIW
jgi:hypothetical protein